MPKDTRAQLLIVDDVTANIKTLLTILADTYQIFFATDGPQALAIATSQPLDLILLDIVMAGMDGYEVCRRLKCSSRPRIYPPITRNP